MFRLVNLPTRGNKKFDDQTVEDEDSGTSVEECPRTNALCLILGQISFHAQSVPVDADASDLSFSELGSAMRRHWEITQPSGCALVVPPSLRRAELAQDALVRDDLA